ncbi:MAG: hypothetical protein LBT10_08940, partial [Methanobrevibacter sp.]|nr:hypothetical protein [Methanobrevibacter sp.]
MIISLIKELSSESFINEMKLKYGSIEKLKEAFEKIKRSILHIDLENWKYLINNLNETIKIGERIFTENMTFGEIELEILTIIKKEAPKSISELSKIIHKDMS